jgi:hypothetical protein
MAMLSYRRHRFPSSIIQHAIWLYLRFTMSYRDVEDLLAERGVDLSYETIRRWVLKFGPPSPSDCGAVDRAPVPVGTSTRWWFGSAATRYISISGAPSITKAKSSTC